MRISTKLSRRQDRLRTRPSDELEICLMLHLFPLSISTRPAHRVRPPSILLTLVFSALLLAASNARAENCYVLIEGAGGDPISALSGTTATGHANETRVGSFGWNAYRAIDGSLIPGSKQLQPVRITKAFDGSSPRLLDAFNSGEVLDTWVLSCDSQAPSPVETLRVTLTGARVVGIASGGTSGGTSGNPADEIVTFSFTQLTWLDPTSGQSGKLNP
jgi:type VI secretion system Hcp family effector